MNLTNILGGIQYKTYSLLMILVELEWFNKTATRLPESIWIEFILY